MKIIFDFDNTLFNRDRFMQELARIFGLSYSDFLASYHHFFKERNKFYHPYEHLRLLAEQKEVSFEQEKKKVEKFLEDSAEFLYPYSIPTLQAVKNSGAKMFLLSKGDQEFQSTKINNCGIAQLFDKIIVTEDKISSLKAWRGEQLIFINDKKEENERVKKEFSNINIYPVGDMPDDYQLKDILALWKKI